MEEGTTQLPSSVGTDYIASTPGTSRPPYQIHICNQPPALQTTTTQLQHKMSSLPSFAAKRARLPQSCICQQQVRHATLLKRPHRPYTFTQLITLSDGSTYTARTTSPKPLFKSTKDTRNHPLWQPSLDSLRNVEQDEAGRLRAFRQRFGRGWDLDSQDGEDGENGVDGKEGGLGEESLMDLISGAGGVDGGYSEKGTGKGGEEGDGGEAVEMIKVMRDGKLVSVPAKGRAERRKQ